MKEEIIALRAKGLSYSQICKEIGCSSATVAYHCSHMAKANILLRKQQQKVWRTEKGKLDSKYRQLKFRYGLTQEAYEKLYRDQNGKCGICEIKLDLGTSKGLLVDHDHVTNKVRGLLCSCCNPGIGQFKDSPELLTNAIKYLRSHGKN